jgi:hypothetical protein
LVVELLIRKERIKEGKKKRRKRTVIARSGAVGGTTKQSLTGYD